MKYLLCISRQGLHRKNPLQRGFTYRFKRDATCACPRADKLVCVEEVRWKAGFQQTCFYCGTPLANDGHVAFLAARFVPFDNIRDALRQAEQVLAPREVDSFIERHLALMQAPQRARVHEVEPH